jgi:hypothetical protein
MFSLAEQIRGGLHPVEDRRLRTRPRVRKADGTHSGQRSRPAATFAALAKQYSEGRSKDSGGDLSYFGQQARWSRKFDDAAWALEVGQTSDIRSNPSSASHIIKLDDKKPAMNRTLGQVQRRSSKIR